MLTTGTGLSVVSAMGFSADEIEALAGVLGMQVALPSIPTTMLADLNVEQLAISAGQDGLHVDAGDGRWVKLGWDADSRAAAVELLPAIGQFLYWDFGDVPAYMVMAEKWIAVTGVELNLYVADAPQESTPTLSMNEPILVEVDGDGGVIADGIDLGPMGVAIDTAMIEPYLDFLPVAVRWDGEASELHLSAGGAMMPLISINPDTLPKFAGLFLSDAVPMEKITAILGDADLEVAVGTEGNVPKPSLDYEVEDTSEKLVYAVPRLVIDEEGNFGLGDPPMRVSSMLEGLGVDISQVTEMARLYALGYGDDIDQLTVTVDPDAIGLSIDKVTAAKILWDEDLRDNLLAIIETYYPIPDIPLIESVFPDWKEDAINAAVGAGWGVWGVEIAIVDEIPASDLETTLQAFGILR